MYTRTHSRSKLDEHARAMLRTDKVAYNDKSSRRGIAVLKGWLNMQGAKIADELKVDMKVIRIRNFLDPQKFARNLRL